MEKFKDGYYWVEYKSSNYVEWIRSKQELDSWGFEKIGYLGENYQEFQQLFKIKAS